MPQDSRITPDMLFPGCTFLLDNVIWTLETVPENLETVPENYAAGTWRFRAVSANGYDREFDLSVPGSQYYVGRLDCRGVAIHCAFSMHSATSITIPEHRPLLRDGWYKGLAGRIYISGNLALIAKNGGVTRLEFNNAYSAAAQIPGQLVSISRSMPALWRQDSPIGSVFMVLKDGQFHSLHIRRSHGIAPLDGYARLTINEIMDGEGYSAYLLTRDPTPYRLAVGSYGLYNGVQVKVLAIFLDDRGVSVHALTVTKSGRLDIDRCESFTDEFTNDRVSHNGYWHRIDSTLPAFDDPPVPGFDASWEVGTEVIKAGTAHDVRAPWLVTNMESTRRSPTVVEYHLQVRRVERNQEAEGYLDLNAATYYLVSGRMYGSVNYTKVADAPEIPVAEYGDLYAGIYGGLYIKDEGDSWRSLNLGDGEDSWASPVSNKRNLTKHRSMYQDATGEWTPFRRVARRGFWYLTGRDREELRVAKDAIPYKSWIMRDFELPFDAAEDVWDSEHSCPRAYFSLFNATCAICSASLVRRNALQARNHIGARVDVCHSHRHDGQVVTCEGCMNTVLASAMHEIGYCNHCVASGRRPSAIRNYSYRPTPNFHGVGPLFMGVELELERKSRSDKDRNLLACEIKAALPNLFYCKSDGSISDGLEIVSHPFSVDYLLAERAKFAKLFEIVSPHMEARDNVGIHIHTSKLGYKVEPSSIPHLKAELDDKRLISRGLLRAQKFVYGNPEMVTHFAGRKSDRYACLNITPGASKNDGYHNRATTTGEIIRLSQHTSAEKLSRYAAMNFTEKTVEFRIFRSTTSLDEYIRNILFVESIVEYSRHHAMPKAGAPSLKAYRAFLEGKERWKPVAEYFDVWMNKAGKAPKAAEASAPPPGPERPPEDLFREVLASASLRRNAHSWR